MNPCKPLVIFSILSLVLFSACSEKDEFTPYLEGDIIGYAFCFDEYGNELEDFSGIQVFIEPGRKYRAVTDKNGRYVLKNVINGTYDLSFEKEDFGTMKLFGIRHLGGKPTIIRYYYSDNYAPFLFKNITTQITHIEYQNDTIISDLTFSGEYTPDRIDMRLFFSSDENFDLLSAEAFKNTELWQIGSKYLTFYGEVSKGLPFAPGETVYCKAAIYTEMGGTGVYNLYSIIGLNSYYDFETNTTVYPNLSNESDEFSFTMP